MRQKIILLCALPVLLFSACYAIVKQRRSDPAQILAAYPKSLEFDEIVETHLREPAQWKSNTTDGAIDRLSHAPPRVFYSTWFQDGSSKVPNQLTVNDRGNVFRFRYMRGWATQGAYGSLLQAAQLSKLKAALHQMPPNANFPTLKNLLIVSFQDGKKWTTRVYDRSLPNPQLAAVYQIIGVPKYSQHPLKTVQ